MTNIRYVRGPQKVTIYHTSYLSFFYTTTFWGLEILHSKVRKFATKIASRQNSVNLRQKLPCDKNCVNHHHTAEIDTMCVKLHTVWKITHCVYNYTLSVKLHAECKITHCVKNYTLCVKLHTECKKTHCVENYTLSVKLHTVWKIYTVWNFALIVKKFPSLEFFYTTAGSGGSDYYEVC